MKQNFQMDLNLLVEGYGAFSDLVEVEDTMAVEMVVDKIL